MDLIWRWFTGGGKLNWTELNHSKDPLWFLFMRISHSAQTRDTEWFDLFCLLFVPEHLFTCLQSCSVVQVKLGLRCSTGGPEHPHVGACCGRGRERSMTCVAVHGINFTSHWTFDVNGTEVVKQSLLPVASRWRHQYCYLQTNISVQVGALM